ncbi:vanadium-dependent haloperoxidase [Algoriphagus namhaensis]|uniref:Vanadium-dependent haloperoxidase n=1 Tax=Algoriphagus namhaensis TaxID=915353 RepID=A0ABV8ANR2_9BACT
MQRLKFLLLLVPFWVLASCQEPVDYSAVITDGHYLNEAQDRITQVIIHDIFSPPVAARIYSYASLGAYEVAAATDPAYASLMGQLRGSENVEFKVSDKVYPPLAALAAYYKVGTSLIFSEDMMNEHRDMTFETLLEKGIPDDVFEASLAFGDEVAAAIIAYSKEDNYHQSRSFPKYTVTNEPGTWEPTPPAYMEGIEPHWNKIRTFVLDSAAQFKPSPPPPYSTDPNSKFYELAMEVYTAGNEANEEQKEIALFWDCNPYKMNVKGHVMFATKKITPGGHWMSIAAIASKAAGTDWKGTAEAFAMTGIALNEAFISCWDEKYRSKLVRPETFINQYIDEEWVPTLQTPPFPEHTSGHSVASAASAYILAELFGDEFHLVDSSEVDYGLPIREFDSFSQAAEEAAISRYYGGIHYLPAIEDGVIQGRQIGELISNRISTKPKNLASN